MSGSAGLRAAESGEQATEGPAITERKKQGDGGWGEATAWGVAQTRSDNSPLLGWTTLIQCCPSALRSNGHTLELGCPVRDGHSHVWPCTPELWLV